MAAMAGGGSGIRIEVFPGQQQLGVAGSSGEPSQPVKEKSREDLLEEGYALIEQRAKIYGPPIMHFIEVATAWSHVIGCKVTPEEVCLCMVELKKARERFKHNEDNIRDEGGYLKLASMVGGEHITVFDKIKRLIRSWT